MTLRINKKRLAELLKEKKVVQILDEAKSIELIKYYGLIEDHIYSKSKKEYYQVVKTLNENKINLDEFYQQFGSIRHKNLRESRDCIKKLELEGLNQLTKSSEIDFSINHKSFEFSSLISSLHSWIDLCDPDIPYELNLKNPELVAYGVSEELFRLRIKEWYLPMLKEYLD